MSTDVALKPSAQFANCIPALMLPWQWTHSCLSYVANMLMLIEAFDKSLNYCIVVMLLFFFHGNELRCFYDCWKPWFAHILGKLCTNHVGICRDIQHPWAIMTCQESDLFLDTSIRKPRKNGFILWHLHWRENNSRIVYSHFQCHMVPLQKKKNAFALGM